MAAIATAQAGNWSATATWTGGVVPASGDTATVNHAVTVDVDTTVGSSPATGGTAAIAVNAALTVASGKVLEVLGDVIVANVALTLSDGSTLRANPATGVDYVLKIGTVNNQTNCRLVCNGLTGSRCTVRLKSGALGHFYPVTAPVQRGGKMTAVFTDFIGLGSATINGWTWDTLGNEIFSMEDCTFNGCGKVTPASSISNATISFHFKRVRWLNSLNATSLNFSGSTAMTGGERTLDRCSIDGALLNNFVDITATECRLMSLTDGSSGPVWASGTQNNILIKDTGTSVGTVLCHEAAPKRWYCVSNTNNNPHWITGYNGRSQTFDQFIFECPNTAVTGDAIQLPNPASPFQYDMRRCYVLPNSNGTSPGKLHSALGNANTTSSVEHCTMNVGGNPEQGVEVGETYLGRAGMLLSVKSNLCWATTGTGHLLTRIGGTVQDIVTDVNVDYNGGWGLDAGTDGSWVDAANAPNFFSTSGLHQTHKVTVSADPFVDKARNMAKWGLSLGGAGTYADTRDNLLALTSGWNVADLIDYVIAGFQVTDPTLNNAGHDGVTIGASGYLAISAVTQQPTMSPSRAVQRAANH